MIVCFVVRKPKLNFLSENTTVALSPTLLHIVLHVADARLLYPACGYESKGTSDQLELIRCTFLIRKFIKLLVVD
jgi:hypothetical protein